jgi:hypothetical protein
VALLACARLQTLPQPPQLDVVYVLVSQPFVFGGSVSLSQSAQPATHV